MSGKIGVLSGMLTSVRSAPLTLGSSGSDVIVVVVKAEDFDGVSKRRGSAREASMEQAE